MNTIPVTRTYNSLTDEERDLIVKKFRDAVAMGATDAGHAAIIAANDAFGLTIKQLNSATGTNCFAMAMTVLVFKGEIKTQPIR